MTAKPIPVWSYEDEYREHRDAILGCCDRVFKSNRLIFGEEGKAFEAEMAAVHSMTGGVGVNTVACASGAVTRHHPAHAE